MKIDKVILLNLISILSFSIIIIIEYLDKTVNLDTYSYFTIIIFNIYIIFKKNKHNKSKGIPGT